MEQTAPICWPLQGKKHSFSTRIIIISLSAPCRSRSRTTPSLSGWRAATATAVRAIGITGRSCTRLANGWMQGSNSWLIVICWVICWLFFLAEPIHCSVYQNLEDGKKELLITTKRSSPNLSSDEPSKPQICLICFTMKYVNVYILDWI